MIFLSPVDEAARDFEIKKGPGRVAPGAKPWGSLRSYFGGVQRLRGTTSFIPLAGFLSTHLRLTLPEKRREGSRRWKQRAWGSNDSSQGCADGTIVGLRRMLASGHWGCLHG